MTGEEAFLAGHCPLTGHYFEPCLGCETWKGIRHMENRQVPDMGGYSLAPPPPVTPLLQEIDIVNFLLAANLICVLLNQCFISSHLVRGDKDSGRPSVVRVKRQILTCKLASYIWLV